MPKQWNVQQNSQFVWRTAATAAARLHLAPCKSGYGLGFALAFFVYLFFIEYCWKRPTNNHLQAAKLHNRPGRISFWVLLRLRLLLLLLLGVIVAIICSKSDTHTQADACTRMHAHAQTSGRQAGKLRQLQLQSEIRYHKAQGISQRRRQSQRRSPVEAQLLSTAVFASLHFASIVFSSAPSGQA